MRAGRLRCARRRARRGCGCGWHATRSWWPTPATSCAGRCAPRAWACTGSTMTSARRRWTLELRRAALALEDLVAAGSGRRAGARAELVDVGALLDDAAEAWRPLAAAFGGGADRRADARPRAGPRRPGAPRASVRQSRGERGRARRRAGARAWPRGGRKGARGGARHGAGPGGAGRVLVSRRRRRGAARGRGLAIAARIAESNGGRLASAPSPRGACLVLELPSADAAPWPEPWAIWPPDPPRLVRAWTPSPPRPPSLPFGPGRPPLAATSSPQSMTRRRRGALLIGLALALGGLAASDVGRREAAVRAQLAPLVDVVVAGRDLPARRRLAPADLALRRIPARYAPVGAASVPEEVLGRRPVAAVPRGAYLGAGQLEDESAPGPARIRRGERAVEVAGAGSPAARRGGRAGRRRRRARARRRAARAHRRRGAGRAAARGRGRRTGRPASPRRCASPPRRRSRSLRSRRARARCGCSRGRAEARGEFGRLIASRQP